MGLGLSSDYCTRVASIYGRCMRLTVGRLAETQTIGELTSTVTQAFLVFLQS
jgi:hypothetical protein